VYALAKLLGISTDARGLSDLSVIARQGSGSACRSLFGGFVKWEMGSENGPAPGGASEVRNGGKWLDSRAVQVASEDEWPDLETLILVTNAAEKDTGSTEGMERSVRTSRLLAYRAKVSQFAYALLFDFTFRHFISTVFPTPVGTRQ
jgi:diphosphomevalonate decarboxylase